ncbi:MAG: KOW motif-containing protein, partial [Bacteroidia bacterium]|nr:KOW motif-containing protein [Bacteroidia bacterium]MDW8335218.1 KOW motif-containing protein [Bacteroidia bacterium]
PDEPPPGITFRVGEMVKVVDGPFDGFSGTVEEVSEDRKKLKVMVTIFGRITPLELDYVQVERME